MFRAAFLCLDCGKTLELDMPDHEGQDMTLLMRLAKARGAVGDAK
jgi:hypothetical protein